MRIEAKALRLYAVTAEAKDADELLRQVAEAIDGGARVVQLREKRRKEPELLMLAKRFACRKLILLW